MRYEPIIPVPRRTTLALVRYAQEALGSAFADRARRNGTVLAYGQTGSGKTHTMFGPEQARWAS